MGQGWFKVLLEHEISPTFTWLQMSSITFTFIQNLGEGEAYVQGTKKVWFLER